MLARRLQGLLMLMLGCSLNVLALEYIVQRDPGSVGSLITLAGYLFVTVSGFLGQWRWPLGGLKPRVIPLRAYFKIAAIFWMQAVLNNAAIGCNISIPMHSVFRSSSLAGSMLAGVVFFRKRYSWRQALACAIVTAGICLATLAGHWLKQAEQLAAPVSTCCGGLSLASANVSGDGCVSNQPPCEPPVTSEAATATTAGGLWETLQHTAAALQDGSLSGSSLWMLGMLLLLAALVLSSIMGHVQSQIFQTYGPSVDENLFYTHLIGLPMFVSLAPEVYQRVLRWAEEPPVLVAQLPASWLGFSGSVDDGTEYSIPLHMSLFALLGVNLVSQLLCIRGVFVFQSVSSAVSTALAVTARKAVSLVFSVWWFGNPFSRAHWLGSALVFAGVLLYSWEPARQPAAPPASPTPTAATARVDSAKKTD